MLAEWRADRLTVWSSTQVPHFLRLFLAILLGVGEDRVRVIAPEVGGGFGSKLQIYAEEIGCAWASRKLGRAVKWIETRSEGMMVTHHGRDQIDYVKVGAKRDGTLTAWHTKIIADIGAYQMLLTPLVPPLSAFVMCGVYSTPAVVTDVTSVHTNKFPTDAIRGAGRPEATHLIEVVMDQFAHELGMDPLELRRKNFIPPFADGHETPIGIVYDSGNYEAALAKLLEHIDPAQVRQEAEALREQGIYRGIGFSTYTEICGNAPSRAVGPGGSRAPGRRLGVRHRPRPRHGLGHAVHRHLTRTAKVMRPASRRSWRTSSESILANVEVIHGDTDTGPFGLDTYGSRSLAVGGEAAAPRCQQGRGQGEGDRRPSARGRSRGHRVTRRQVLGTRIAGQGPDAGRGGGRRVRDDGHARRHGAGTERERRSTTLRTSCSRSARTRAWSTSTRRPERSRSSAGSRSTTVDRRSTRC